MVGDQRLPVRQERRGIGVGRGEGDGDLVDALVDALTNLGDSGVVWLLTPKAGRSGHVEPSDIDEAAPTAGLSSTRSTSAAPEWSGTRLVAPKASRAKQRR